MKKFTYLTVVWMIAFMLIGCATIWPEQVAEHRSDLLSDVGNSQFVGDTSHVRGYGCAKFMSDMTPGELAACR